MDNIQTQSPPLTIARVKACISFTGSPIQQTLENLCDCWYEIAKGEGKSDEEAAKVAMDNLAEKLLNFGA